MIRHCPVCDYPNASIGALGNRDHYVCRACGINYSHPKRRRSKKHAVNRND